MYKIKVYMDDGRVFSYEIIHEESVREHLGAISRYGYQHNDGKVLEYYPVHRVRKVKCIGEFPTDYPDKVEGT